MTNVQFNTLYCSLNYQGVRYPTIAPKRTVDALKARGWVDSYGVVTFDGLLAMLRACLDSKRSNTVKKIEIVRIAAFIDRYNLK